jgi:two-component system, cell cycle sensor histidine kinase and response regulator CckA
MHSEPRPTILNVDDDPGGRDATTRVLEREGFVVKEADTGSEALRLAETMPDLILLGVHLPDVSGLEVCRRLKQEPRTHVIPIVHLSANPVAPESRTAALECGADAYLKHPLDPGLLVATIRALLRARRAENDARERARVWQTTFDAISHGVCLIDSTGIVRQVNRSICSLLGMQPEALIGQPHYTFFESVAEPPEGWVFDRVRRTLQQESYDLEIGDRWFHITADPLLGANGEFAGAVRTVIDITEGKRADEERDRLLRQLESERARLEAVLRQMPAGVIMAEAPAGTILLRNEQVEAIFRGPFRTGGGPRDYLQYAAFRPDGSAYAPHELPLARTVGAGETVTNEEIRFTRSDGSRATVLVSSVPIRNREGYVIAAMAVLHDVSERHELESQIRRSQKMEAIGRLAGGAAHDFNNLLTIIGGYGQMALDALGPKDPLRNDLEAILEASSRAGALTRQLLTFSRRQMVQPKTLDLNRYVAKVSRMLRRVIGEDISLVTSLNSTPARIRLDPAQLEQVLLNIAVNARDAMPTGGTLTIDTALVDAGENGAAPRTLDPGRYVRLSMTDTGTGMNAETLSHLFEPFYTTKAKGKGTGLGLSTVYGVVKQGGGEIAVQSEPGRGTAVQIYFPASGEKGRPAAGPPLHGRSAETGTETILLVEDEAEVRRLASQMLTRQGYSVLEAASGAEALRLWQQHRASIGMVLTDVIMPQMSGPQLVEQLEALSPGVRVMYMSGYTDDVLARHGLAQTKMPLLHKPFTLDSLAAMVRSVLNGKEAR